MGRGVRIRTSNDGGSVGAESLYSRYESCNYCTSKVGFQIQMHSLKDKAATLKWQAPIRRHCLVSALFYSWTGLHTTLTTYHEISASESFLDTKVLKPTTTTCAHVGYC